MTHEAPLRLYADHDYQRGLRCSRRADLCNSFTKSRWPARELSCTFCGLCIQCTPDVALCTNRKSRAAVSDAQRSANGGGGVTPPDDGQLSISPDPAPTTPRRVRRGAA